ncbi:MAG TPA: hypothetical protein VHX49_03940 [Candidatus Acidoferrales bacterium]|nr:hypothetical protein [Candidatus Acidoferrales bacterium]
MNLAGVGGGLILQDSRGEQVAVQANGSFMLPEPLASGHSYDITISTQPTNPTQICRVTDGSGVAIGDVTNIEVNCGHNEWMWAAGPDTGQPNGVYGNMGTAATTNNPGGRQTPATWTDSSRDLWLFGGYGLDSTGTLLPMNDLWKYSNGVWTWVAGPDLGGQKGVYGTPGVAAAGNIPGARYEAVTWTDAEGNFWLFGGEGYDSAGNEGGLGDLWKYANGEWTWMGGSALENQPSTYGTLRVPAAGNTPGARFGAAGWIDASGNFWLFGGWNFDLGVAHGTLNDLWKYSDGEWTWESGSQSADQPGVYGTQGAPAPGNVPRSRYWAATWTDLSGNLWLFGGANESGFLSDLWEYRNGEWAWISGPTQTYEPGVYGIQETAAPANNPGARQLAVAWTDSAGNFWLAGGNGIDSANGTGLLNDLWKYSGGQWTWMSGSKVINQDGVYGTQGMLAPGDTPGARFESGHWVDSNGNLWLFGGYGVARGTEGNLSDLWMYMP